MTTTAPAPQPEAPAASPEAPPKAEPAPAAASTLAARSLVRVAGLTGSAAYEKLKDHLSSDKGSSHVTGLQKPFAEALAKTLAKMPPHLADQVEIFSGARTTQRQAELYQQAVAKYGAAGASKWVAPPGHSKHEHGIAADMRFGSKEARAAFVAAAATEGIHQPMSHEPWHFELAGAGGVRIHHNQGSYYSARGNHGGGSNGGVSISSGLGGKGHFEPYSQSPQIAETSDRKRFLEYLVSQGILSKAEASSEQFMDKFSHAVMDLTSKEGFKLGPGGIESVYADAAKLVREGYQPSTGYSTVDTGGYSGPLWAREAFNSSPGAA